MTSKYCKTSKIFISIFMFLAIFSWNALPSFAIDEVITDRYPSVGPPPREVEKKQVEEDIFDQVKKRLDISVYADLQQGYDNNVDLDSQRHKDGFLQSSVNVDITYEAMDKLKLKTGVDVFQTIYYKYNDNNLLDIAPYVGFDLELIPGVVSRNRFIYDYFSFPNYKESTYNGIVLSSYLRHYIIEDLYHEVGYEYLHRWYPDRKSFLSSGIRGNDDRIDSRHRTKYNIGFYSERFFVSLSNQLSWNDSNDTYQDYYDYWLYRLRPSIMYFFTDKFYTNVSFIYRYTHYKDRRSTEDINKKERDNTYILNTSFYYDITKNVTFGVTYSYSENLSNDPFQKYSGSIVTGGIYYTF